MPRIIIFLGLLTMIIGSGVAQTLETTTVKREKVPRELHIDGIVEAVKKATVSAQTSGTITKLIFDVNDYVVKGDVIAEFRNTEQKAALKQAKANLDEAVVLQSDAKAEFERISKVFKQGAVSRSQMDKVTASLKSGNARVDAARAAWDKAREQFDYTLIRAPYSGIVTERHVQVGEAAKPGTAIMTGLSLDDLRVLAQVPQRLIGPVARYEQARILVQGDTPQTIHSSLVTVFPYANTTNHAFTVRVELPHGVKGLFPGMYVKVAFLVGEDEKLLIPAQAIVRHSEVTAVYVQQADGYVEMRQIRVGKKRKNNHVEVLAGLEENEIIILDPLAAIIQKKQTKSQ